MQLVPVYRYRVLDPECGICLISSRMGTREAIEAIDEEVMSDEWLTVKPAELSPAGWTKDGYWNLNKPPYYV